MSEKLLPRTAAAEVDEIFYPCQDGQPLAETEAHLMAIFDMIATLRQFFANRPDYYVIGDMFLYWEEGHPEARKAPDVMVVKGVEPKPPHLFFKIWEERATPAVIFEMTSRSTADEDIGGKYRLYEQLGVKEYFLFDPHHEYLERPLVGYRLIGRHYEPLIPSANGCLISSELQVQLCPDGVHLNLFDFRTGKRLPTPKETNRLWQEAAAEVARLQKWADSEIASAQERIRHTERLRQEEQKRADNAERERQEQKQRADEAERRLAELKAELARLRPEPPTNGHATAE